MINASIRLELENGFIKISHIDGETFISVETQSVPRLLVAPHELIEIGNWLIENGNDADPSNVLLVFIESVLGIRMTKKELMEAVRKFDQPYWDSLDNPMSIFLGVMRKLCTDLPEWFSSEDFCGISLYSKKSD